MLIDDSSFSFFPDLIADSGAGHTGKWQVGTGSWPAHRLDCHNPKEMALSTLG